LDAFAFSPPNVFNMSELLNGILLRRTRYSDTSLIISWFTDRRGKLRTMAKGVFRQKSVFSGKLDLFFHCDLLISFSRKTDLHTLREVSIRAAFEHIRKDYLRTSVASYFVELVDEVTEPDHPVPEIYQLLLRALGYLDARIPETRGVLFFESELCKCLGLYTPDLHSAADKLVETFGRLPRTRAHLMAQL
jgi:DNA repair protein RecO (recombination protein O)